MLLKRLWDFECMYPWGSSTSSCTWRHPHQCLWKWFSVSLRSSCSCCNAVTKTCTNACSVHNKRAITTEKGGNVCWSSRPIRALVVCVTTTVAVVSFRHCMPGYCIGIYWVCSVMALMILWLIYAVDPEDRSRSPDQSLVSGGKNGNC